MLLFSSLLVTYIWVVYDKARSYEWTCKIRVTNELEQLGRTNPYIGSLEASKGLGIQQETSGWVGSPKPRFNYVLKLQTSF